MVAATLPVFPEHISYSALKTWRECQWLWKLIYVDKHYSDDDFGVYRDFGSAIHRTIELSRPNDKKKPITYWRRHFQKCFSLLFKKHFEKYKEKDKLLLSGTVKSKSFTFEDFIAAGERILKDFLKDEVVGYGNSKVLNNELKIFEVVGRTDDVEIKFKGYIDLVILTKDGRGKPVIYVVDFKTCGWGWSIEQKRDPDLQDQLFLYKYFLCKRFNIDQKQVRVAFLLMKRTPSKKQTSSIEFLSISAGPVSVQRSIDGFNQDISEMISRFSDGKLRKNRSACINRFGDKCRFFDSEHCTKEDMTMKVIVAGPRDIEAYEDVVKAIKDSGFPIREIVSGMAKGVDTLGERYAAENGLPVKQFPALWDKFGTKAGPLRNQQMSEYADALVVITKPGGSPGTSDMISRARKAGLKVYVHELKSF